MFDALSAIQRIAGNWIGQSEIRRFRRMRLGDSGFRQAVQHTKIWKAGA
jgi:hypothetical protein